MVLVCLLTVFFFSLSLSFLTFFSLCCVGLGMTWGFSKYRFANVYEMPRTVVSGVWGGGAVNSMHCHILLHVCDRRGGGGGKRGKNTIAKLPKYD